MNKPAPSPDQSGELNPAEQSVTCPHCGNCISISKFTKLHNRRHRRGRGSNIWPFHFRQKVAWKRFEGGSQEMTGLVIRSGPLNAVVQYEDEHGWIKFATVPHGRLRAAE